MRYYQFFLLCALAAGTTGCAITSGLQTFDLPSEGVYQTELGTPVNVLKLTQESLPALQPAQVNIQQDYAHLFSSPHKNYKLSAGDILSIFGLIPILHHLLQQLIMINMYKPMAIKLIKMAISNFP